MKMYTKTDWAVYEKLLEFSDSVDNIAKVEAQKSFIDSFIDNLKKIIL